MAAQGRSDITTEIQSKFPTNNVKFITALLLREFEEIINESKFNLVDDTLENINLTNTDLGDNAEAALENIVNIVNNSGSVPLFYVNVNYTRSGGGGGNISINSFSSNNSSVTVSGGGTTGTHHIVIDYNDLQSDFSVDAGYVTLKQNLSGGTSLVTAVGTEMTNTECRISTDIASGAGSRDITVFFFPAPTIFIVDL